MSYDRRPNPLRRDPPEGAPVVFDDDEEPPRRSGSRRSIGYESDAGLLRILALILVLGIVILVLVLPWSPLRVIGREDSASGAGGVTAVERGDPTDLPAGAEALSKLYEIRIPDGAKGPWTIDVPLERLTRESANVAYYSYGDGRWTRLTPVTVSSDGRVATGDIANPPGAIAVLRRTGQARTLGLIVGAGEAPDPTAVHGASVIVVMSAVAGPAGNVQARSGAGALEPAVKDARSAKVFLGVSADAPGGGPSSMGEALAVSATATKHVEGIAAAAGETRAAGVYLEYGPLAAAQRDAFTNFVRALRERLQRDQRGLIVGVQAGDGANGGGYDWTTLAANADALWLRPSNDPAAYYEGMERLLAAQRDAGVGLDRVSLILGRDSRGSSGAAPTPLTLRAALTEASAMDPQNESAVPAGGQVTLRAVHLGDGQGKQGLRWDDTARAVTFSYNASSGRRMVWVENRFSAAFRLDLAARFGLGGVAVDQARRDDALPDLWGVVTTFVQDGAVQLQRPYGPYLAPCWQAAGGTVDGATACWTADTAAASVTWRAPGRAGTHEVRLVVSDGTLFVGQQLLLRVQDGAAAATATAPAAATATATATAARTATAVPTVAPTTAPTSMPTSAATPTAARTATPAATSPAAGGPPGPAGQ